MYQFSDTDSVDSDKGVRFKTESTRNKERCTEKDSINKKERRKERRSRSRSPDCYKSKRRTKTSRKDYSSEDDVERNRQHKDRKRNKKRHREKEKVVGPSNSPKEKHKDSIHLKNETLRESESSRSNELHKTENTDKGPILGPSLPPHLLQRDILPNNQLIDKSVVRGYTKNVSNAEVNSPPLSPSFKKSNIEDNVYGPKIPELVNVVSTDLPSKLGPENPKTNTSTIIGPALPPNFKLPMTITNCDEDAIPQENSRVIGPSLPPDLRKRLEENMSTEAFEEDSEVYGPIPVGENFSKAHVELEERALKIRIDQLEPQTDKQPTREEWMMTLPEAKAMKFGLGPRSFRAKAGPDLSDRSSWTDTPEDKAKKMTGKVEPKIDLQKEAELKELYKRDKEQEALAKKSKKHDESLLEMHKKKLKKEKNEKDPNERRPFSREIDLQVNRFDEAQKKAVLKKAQLLDTRFSTGESKYL